MKVVLLHDWVLGYRGGERVLDAFCELFPDAPLYTLFYQEGCSTTRIDHRKIVSSYLNSMPGSGKHYRKLLPLFPGAVERLEIEEKADLVLSSSHCVIKGLRKPEGAKHISYIHSPMRYLYDQYDAYFGDSAPLYQRMGMKVFRNYLTAWDKKTNSNVDHMIANSSFVKERIATYYNREAKVIHPFVDLKDFRERQHSASNKDDFFLVLSAFAPNKRVDLAIEAFNQNGKKLVVIGSGQQEDFLKSIAKNNISFKGNLSRSEVIDLLFRARALIFPGVEDFGITPLEALASGTPVIAFKKGGVLETLNEQTAIFFKEQTNESLLKAIELFESKKFDQKTLYQRAEEFSREHFLKYIQSYIQEVVK